MHKEWHGGRCGGHFRLTPFHFRQSVRTEPVLFFRAAAAAAALPYYRELARPLLLSSPVVLIKISRLSTLGLWSGQIHGTTKLAEHLGSGEGNGKLFMLEQQKKVMI